MSRITLCRSALLVGLVLASCGYSTGQDTESDILRYEKTLKDASIGTDVESLLQFFRARTLSEKEKTRLREFVPQLGDRSFTVRDRAERELMTRGRAVLPLLRPAINNKDLEIARRVQRYIDELENGEESTLAVAAARLLVAKKVPEAAEVILHYVPVVGDDTTLEVLELSVAELGFRDGKLDRAVVAALASPEPSSRAAAAHAVGLANARQRGALKPLLTDPDPRVRLKAATALVRGADAEAVTALMHLLPDAPLTLAAQAEDVLYQLAGEKAPSTALTAVPQMGLTNECQPQ